VIFSSVRDHQNRVILSGWDGDTTVSSGFEYLPYLIRTGKWRATLKETTALAKKYGVSRRRLVVGLGIKPLVPESMFRMWRRLHGRNPDRWPAGLIVNRAFAHRIQLGQRLHELQRKYDAPLRNPRETHRVDLSSGMLVYGLELLDKCASRCSVEARFPFCDRRLIEFCVAVPPELKLRHGWPRSILRLAMEGILPEEVRWRVSKGHLGTNFKLRFLDEESATLERLLMRDDSALGAYLDMPAIQGAYQQLSRQPLKSDPQSVQVFLAATLALWLESSGLCSAVS
jgi:asparagine synthase (glutamine-hydrolysing)